MALYGGKRDIVFFRSINRELFNKNIQVEIDIIKKSLYDTDVNLYGEALNKVYYPGVRIACKINVEDQSANYEEQNIDILQNATYRFLRDDLIKKDIVIETGDIIHWNDKYWEVNNVIENKYYLGRNPDTNKTIGPDWGWNITIMVTTHQTKKSLQKLDEIRAGNNTQNLSINKKDTFY